MTIDALFAAFIGAAAGYGIAEYRNRAHRRREQIDEVRRRLKPDSPLNLDLKEAFIDLKLELKDGEFTKIARQIDETFRRTFPDFKGTLKPK